MGATEPRSLLTALKANLQKSSHLSLWIFQCWTLKSQESSPPHDSTRFKCFQNVPRCSTICFSSLYLVISCRRFLKEKTIVWVNRYEAADFFFIFTGTVRLNLILRIRESNKGSQFFSMKANPVWLKTRLRIAAASCAQEPQLGRGCIMIVNMKGVMEISEYK